MLRRESNGRSLVAALAALVVAGCGELLPGERLALLQAPTELACGAVCPDGARCRYAVEEGRRCVVACDSTSVAVATARYGEWSSRNDAARLCPSSDFAARACAPVDCDAAVVACVGRPGCAVTVGNAACGGDPCRGCAKRSTVEISCAPRPIAVERACGVPCARGQTCRYAMPGERPLEGQTCTVACEPGSSVVSISAEYGAWSVKNTGGRCARDRYLSRACRAADCPSSVAACEGRTSCAVRLDNRACADPCLDCIKSGTVRLRCSP